MSQFRAFFQLSYVVNIKAGLSRSSPRGPGSCMVKMCPWFNIHQSNNQIITRTDSPTCSQLPQPFDSALDLKTSVLIKDQDLAWSRRAKQCAALFMCSSIQLKTEWWSMKGLRAGSKLWPRLQITKLHPWSGNLRGQVPVIHHVGAQGRGHGCKVDVLLLLSF